MPKSFGAKLKEIRTVRDLSQDELAALLGTTKQVISRYENEQRTPKLDTVQEYARLLNIPLLYLVDNNMETMPAPASQKDDGVEFLPDDEPVSFPVVGSIAAGYDHEPIYDLTDEVQLYPRSMLHGRPATDFFVLRVKGKSMEPVFCDGDSVLIQRCDAVDQGTVAVILYNGDEATLKKVRYTPQWLDMIPLNPDFAVRRIEGSELARCRIMGKAVSLSRDLSTI